MGIKETINPCCGLEPEVFHDKKVGRNEIMVVIMCSKCSRFVDGSTLPEAVKNWNER